jgi:uncharacterized protein involved in exopolysaccharide biosynthesis
MPPTRDAKRIVEDAPPRVDIRPFMAAMRDGAPWIAGSVIVCVLAALAFILVSTPTYVASGRILIDPAGLEFLGDGPVSRSGGGAAGTIEAESQIYVIGSREVLERVVAGEGLADSPQFGARRGLLGQFAALLGRDAGGDREALALMRLERALSVTRNQGSLVATVNVRTGDRAVSARVANAVMDAYLEEELRASVRAAQRAASALEARLNDLRSRLRQAEDRYERYRRDNDLVTSAGQPSLEQQVEQLSTQFTAAEAQVNELTSTLADIERLRGGAAVLDAIPETLRTGAVATLRERHAAARQAEANLATSHGPLHPAYIAAREQTAEVQRLVDQEIGHVMRSIDAALQRARAARTGARERLDAATAELGRLDESAVGLRELAREVEASRTVYEAFLARSRELSEQTRFDTSNTRIISRAAEPLAPSGPPSLLVLAAAIVLGLGLGTALAWLREQLRPQP